MRLSIVIPAHNEEKRIGPMLEAYLPFFSARYGKEVEFLVVINGSSDKTDEVVAGYVNRFPCIRGIVKPERIGKGGAVMEGFRQARGDYVGFVDADGSTPPEAFQELVDNIGEAGGIIASRWSRGAKVSPPQPLDRRVASRVFNFITRVLFGLRLTDTQCGAKLMRREAVEAILGRLGITQWAFDVDLLFQLRRAGYVIKEVPTIWHDVEGSKIQVGKASAEMILALVRLRLLYSPCRWIVAIYDRFLGPWIHPAGTMRDHLLTHSLILFVGAQFGNVCNLIFQVVMARMLGNVDYGVMSTMFGALMMLGMPLTALGGAVTHFTALFMANDERGKIKAMVASVGRDLLIPAILVVLAGILTHQELMVAFKMDSSAPLYLALVTAVVMLFGALPNGVLGGMQAFEWSALIGNVGPLLRVVFGVVLVLFGFGTVGGLTAHILGLLVSVVFAFVICGSLWGRDRVVQERPVGIYSYMGGYLAAFTAYGVLSSTDVLLVKYYFPPEQAGIFSKAAMVARMVFFLPGPICAALFPKVTSVGESSPATRRTLYKAMVVTVVMVASVVLACFVFPGLILKIMVKDVQPGQIEILRGMVIALTPLTLILVLMSYELAQRRFKIMIPLFFAAAGYLLGAWRWHETPLQIVGVLGVMSLVALGLSLLFIRKDSRGLAEGNIARKC